MIFAPCLSIFDLSIIVPLRVRMIICRHSDIVIQYSSQYGHVSKSRAGICAQGACRTSTLCAATKPRSTAILKLRSNQDDKIQETNSTKL